MNAGTKLAALNKFKGSSSNVMRPQTTRVLVVYDVPVKAPDVAQVPLVINYGKRLYHLNCFFSNEASQTYLKL